MCELLFTLDILTRCRKLKKLFSNKLKIQFGMMLNVSKFQTLLPFRYRIYMTEQMSLSSLQSFNSSSLSSEQLSLWTSFANLLYLKIVRWCQFSNPLKILWIKKNKKSLFSMITYSQSRRLYCSLSLQFFSLRRSFCLRRMHNRVMRSSSFVLFISYIQKED